MSDFDRLHDFAVNHLRSLSAEQYEEFLGRALDRYAERWDQDTFWDFMQYMETVRNGNSGGAL